jgi:hypothetical protein
MIWLVPIEFAEIWEMGLDQDDDLNLVHKIDVIGTFTFEALIMNTWNGFVRRNGFIGTKKGLIVGDPCYIFHKNWDKLISNYTNLDVVILDTGGDGEFTVELELEPR